MPITSTDIEFRYSGGAANNDPDQSLGGTMSSYDISSGVDNNLFDDVTGDEASSGDTEYRCLYVINIHGSLTWLGVKVWIQSLTTSTDDEIDIAIAPEGKNGTAETIANENTEPSGVSWKRPTSKVHADVLNVGDLDAGDWYPVWVRRTVEAASSAFNGNSCTLKAEGDTLA